MIRKIIHIDEDKCNGCGLCAAACHEGAIGMENGKAKLLRDDYCDGLGDCLPVCPTGAIAFEEREAAGYDEAAVKAKMAAKNMPARGCPGSMARHIPPPAHNAPGAGREGAQPAAARPGNERGLSGVRLFLSRRLRPGLLVPSASAAL